MLKHFILSSLIPLISSKTATVFTGEISVLTLKLEWLSIPDTLDFSFCRMSTQPICQLSKTLHNSYNLPSHFRENFVRENIRQEFPNLQVESDLRSQVFDVSPKSDSDLAMTDCLDDLLVEQPSLCKHITPYDKISKSDQIQVESIQLDPKTWEILVKVQIQHFSQVNFEEIQQCSEEAICIRR